MDDGFLIAQVLRGNREAFRLLVIRYQRPMFRFLGGFGIETAVVEELAQEAFLRAYRNLATYRPGMASFSSWLFAIAKHLALNEAAAAHRRRGEERDGEASSDGQAVAGSAQATLEKAERLRRVRRAIAALPAALRGTVVLAYVKELSLNDIAAIEGCSLGTVKSRLFRGRQLLRAALAASEDGS